MAKYFVIIESRREYILQHESEILGKVEFDPIRPLYCSFIIGDNTYQTRQKGFVGRYFDVLLNGKPVFELNMNSRGDKIFMQAFPEMFFAVRKNDNDVITSVELTNKAARSFMTIKPYFKVGQERGDFEVNVDDALEVNVEKKLTPLLGFYAACYFITMDNAKTNF